MMPEPVQCAPDNAEPSPSRFQFTSNSGPRTAHAPGFRPPLLPIPSCRQLSPDSPSLRLQAPAAPFPLPGVSNLPRFLPQPRPQPDSRSTPNPRAHPTSKPPGPARPCSNPPAITEKIVLGPQRAHIHVHRIFHGVVART